VKLKREVPSATNRFHAALDALEDELYLAQLVMRRDLAVAREKAGQPAKINTTAEEARPDQPETPDVDTNPATVPEAEPSDTNDLSMQDDNEEVTATNDDLFAELSAPEPPAQQTEDGAPISNQASEPAPSTGDEKPQESLRIETKPPPQDANGQESLAADDKAPDTGALSTNADLESLFNDPVSAGGGDNTDFGLGTNDNGDFVFEAFSSNLDNGTAVNSNDDIASLLPGLQDYANTQPEGSGEPDFSDLFSTNAPPANGEGQPASGTNGEQQTSLDDLMDFSNFEFSGEGDANANTDFDFDFGN
jgi:hypothetical protein